MCGQHESPSRSGQLHRFVSITLPPGFMHVRLRSGSSCLVHASNFLLSPSNLTNL